MKYRILSAKKILGGITLFLDDNPETSKEPLFMNGCCYVSRKHLYEKGIREEEVLSEPWKFLADVEKGNVKCLRKL